MIDGIIGGLAFRLCNREQLTCACDVVDARPFGEQAAMAADAVQALWRHGNRQMNSSVASDKRFYRSPLDSPST
jgi:hypothetical protein